MAELILTEEEEEQNSFLNWNDEDLGKLVKKKAIELEDYYGDHVTGREAAVAKLIAEIAASEEDPEMAVMEVQGITVEGEDLGHWRITFERVDPNIDGNGPFGNDIDNNQPPDQDGGLLV